jgi:hypothetical protein
VANTATYRSLGCGLATIAALATAACGTSPITQTRMETALSATFANLVQVQVSWLGLPAMTASDFGAKATCRRLTAGDGAGSGEWICTVTWRGPEKQFLRDTYDLFVMPDGCYMAQVSGESLGGPLLKTAAGNDVRNLLYAFDGCFDTTSSAT